MQAVGEKQERHALHMVHVGPCNLKSTDSEDRELETCYEKMRRWLTVGCQLGCLATTNGSGGHAPVSLSLHLSPCHSPLLLLISPYAWSREVGKSWSSLCMNNTGIKFPCNDFFPSFFCLVSQVQHGKHHHQQQQQQCRWADRNMALIWVWIYKDAQDGAATFV